MNEKKIIIFLFLSLFTTSFIFGTVSAEDTVLIGKGPDYQAYLNETNNETFLEIYPFIINFFDGFEYRSIDEEIVQEDCEYDYCVREGAYYVDFKEYSDNEEIAKVSTDESYITYTPMELKYSFNGSSELISNVINVVGFANDSVFTYPGIYGNGISLEYDYTSNFLKESLVIEESTDLPSTSFNDTNQTHLSLIFKVSARTLFEENWEENEFYLTGHSLEINQSLNNTEFSSVEEITFRGFAEVAREGSEPVFRIYEPYAIDSNNQFISLDYYFYVVEGETYISILTPYEWLKDEERIYPVKIDPTTGLIGLSSFGFVYYASWSNSYEFLGDFGSTLESGTYVDSGGYSNSRNYLHWDFSNSLRDILKQANINSAKFDFTVVNVSPGSNPLIEVYQFPQQSVDLNPSTQAAKSSLFNVIDNGVNIYTQSNPSILNSYSADVDEGDLESKIDIGADLILGIKGYESSSNIGLVKIGTKSPSPPATVFIDYSCTQVAGCNQYCDINLGIGQSCDCSQECSSGYCSATTGLCSTGAICGDQQIEQAEECDDGNTQGGDGCDASCEIENGWTCSGQPSQCQENDDEYDNGIINVYTQDSSGKPLGGLYATLNGGSGKTTDEDGWTQYNNIDDVSGDDAQTVQVKCSSQGSVCGSASTKISYDGDEDSLYFTCDICSPKKDLLIDKNELIFKKIGSDTQVNVTVNSIGMNENVDVVLRKVCAGNKISLPTQSVSVSAGQKKVVSFTSNFDGCEKLEVSVEEFAVESDKNNNHIKDFFVIDPVKVHLTTSTGFSLVNQKINEFIGDFAQVVSAATEADLRIYIGANANKQVLESQGWLVNELVSYNGLKEGLPYNGLIAQRKVSGQTAELYVFGNDLDGTVAAVRRMIDERDEYLNKNKLGDNKKTYLSETDVDAISVYDYFHTDENDGFYKDGSPDFADIVDNVLRKQTFNLAIKRVLTANDQTSLRLKNVNHELSPQFKEFANERPVVLANPLFGNLFSMEDLGLKIAKDEKFSGSYVRDVWLAELTGGPNTDCSECPNYDYDDLIDHYWPAAIGGVLAYTGEQKVDYVGYSASGGIGARSYEEWDGGITNAGEYLDENEQWQDFDLPANSVDHMALIAPMGAFNGDTVFTECIDEYGDDLNQYLANNGFERVNREVIATSLLFVSLADAIISQGIENPCLLAAFTIKQLSEPGNNISYGFWEDIVADVHDKNNDNPQLNNLNKLMIIRGDLPSVNNDAIIPDNDLEEIYLYSISNEKYKAKIQNGHADAQNDKETYDPLLAKFLRGVLFSPSEKDNYEIEGP